MKQRKLSYRFHDVLETLLHRSRLFPYSKVHYFLFSKSGFTKGCMEKASELGNVTLVEYADMLRGLTLQQQLPEVLLAYLLKHFSHVVRELRRNALIDQIGGPTGDQGIVLIPSSIRFPFSMRSR